MTGKISASGRYPLGLFIKTASYQTVEVVALGRPDFVVLDAEHAPLTRSDLDGQLLAARSMHVPALVRVPDSSSSFICSCLDMGAAGVVVPHVSDPDTAAGIVKTAHFENGTRGFSTSPRAGQYGATAAPTYIKESDASIEVWCQIEDPAGIDNVEGIAATEGVDCLFIGRADLAVSLSAASMEDPVLDSAIERIVAAGKSNDVTLATFLTNLGEIPRLIEMGIEAFIAGTDQGLLRQGMTDLRARFDRETGQSGAGN